METEIQVELLKSTMTVNMVKVGRLCKMNHLSNFNWLIKIPLNFNATERESVEIKMILVNENKI